MQLTQSMRVKSNYTGQQKTLFVLNENMT